MENKDSLGPCGRYNIHDIEPSYNPSVLAWTGPPEYAKLTGQCHSLFHPVRLAVVKELHLRNNALAMRRMIAWMYRRHLEEFNRIRQPPPPGHWSGHFYDAYRLVCEQPAVAAAIVQLHFAKKDSLLSFESPTTPPPPLPPVPHSPAVARAPAAKLNRFII